MYGNVWREQSVKVKKRGQFHKLFLRNFRTTLTLIALPLLLMMCLLMFTLIRQRYHEGHQRHEAAMVQALDVFESAANQQRRIALNLCDNPNVRTLLRVNLQENSPAKLNALDRISSALRATLVNDSLLDDVFLSIVQPADSQPFIIRAGSAYHHSETADVPAFLDFSSIGYALTSRVHTGLQEHGGGYVLVEDNFYFGQPIGSGNGNFVAVCLSNAGLRAKLRGIIGTQRFAVAMDDQIIFDTQRGTLGSSLDAAIQNTSLRVLTAEAFGAWQCVYFYDLSDAAAFARRIVFICAGIMFVMLLLSAYLCRRISARLIAPYQTIIALLSSPDQTALESYEEKYASSDELGLIYALVHQTKYRNFALQSELTEREVALSDAQNIALQSQITPHFLFNTLEAINWRLFEKLPEEQEIPRMIQKLSLLFRMSLDSKERLVPLKREMIYARTYLEMQDIRFQGRYEVLWDVNDDAQACMVMQMCLQPLLENAISYGVTRVEHGRLIVRARTEGETFLLEVEDNGPGMTGEKLERLQKVLRDSRYTHSDHIGLINVNARVQLLYGVSYGLTLESVPFERTRVCLKMPRIASDETAPTGGNPNV